MTVTMAIGHVPQQASNGEVAAAGQQPATITTANKHRHATSVSGLVRVRVRVRVRVGVCVYVCVRACVVAKLFLLGSPRGYVTTMVPARLPIAQGPT